MVLEEYAGLFAYYGTLASLPFFVCPLFACWNIIKYGCSDFLPPNTFLDGLLRSILLYYHGKLLMSNFMMQQNLFGIILQLIYLALYYFYLRYKAPFHKAAIKSGAFIAITLLYVQWESPVLAPHRFGYILTLLNLSTLIYPIMGVKYIVTTKCTYGIPYTIIFCGQIVTTFWLLFAISVHNYIFMLQMLIPFILGAVQIVLYFVYPSTPKFFTAANPLTMPSMPTMVSDPAVKDKRSRLAELRQSRLAALRQERTRKKSG